MALSAPNERARGGFGEREIPGIVEGWLLCVSIPKPVPRAPCCPFTCATGLSPSTEPSQRLCSAPSSLEGLEWLSQPAAAMGHSVQLSTPALLSCTQHRVFTDCWSQNYSYSSTRLFGKALALCWSYCKVALLVNSNYKLVNSTMVELLWSNSAGNSSSKPSMNVAGSRSFSVWSIFSC